MSSRDSLDEILDKFLSKVYADSVEDGVMKAVVKREVFQELEQSLHQWALDKQIELVKKLWAMERIPASQAKGGVVEEQSFKGQIAVLELQKGDIDER